MSNAAKQAAILRSLADQVAQPVIAGRDGRKALKPKQRGEWKKITDVVVEFEDTVRLGSLQSMTPERLSEHWKRYCQSSLIGVGWFANWVFWNWAFPLLIELAKLWIESQRNADTQQGLAGER